MKPYDKQLVLENGKQFFGYGFGADKSAINEIVFNTSMVGYQEIVCLLYTSPSPRDTR